MEIGLFDYQELLYLGGDKDLNPNFIGKYGEGWKASVLNALRNFNCHISTIVGNKKLVFYFKNKDIGGTQRRVIYCDVSETENINGALLIIENCSEEIIKEFIFGLKYFYYTVPK